MLKILIPFTEIYKLLCKRCSTMAGIVYPDRRKSRSSEKWVFTSPTLIFLMLVLLVPVLYSFYTSFTGWKLTIPESKTKIVGFDNYKEIFKESAFWRASRVTLIYTFASLALEFTLGFIFAFWLNKEFIGRRVARLLIIIPIVIPPAVVGMFWKLLYADSGVLNYILELIRLSRIRWLSHELALLSVIIMEFWQMTPFVTLIILAGLQEINPSILEAAEVDGANRIKIIRYIALPHLVPYILTISFFRMGRLLTEFDKTYLLTGGGPGTATKTISILGFEKGFRVLDIGETSAISWIFLVMVFLIISPLIYVMYRRIKSEK